MSKTWKWILGILLVLVVIAAFGALGFVWRGQMFAAAPARVWGNPMMGPGANGWNMHPHMNPRYLMSTHPMMGGGGFLPFGGFFLFGGLLKWLLFFGLLYGAYWLGKRNARFALDPKPAARVDASAPPKTPERDS